MVKYCEYHDDWPEKINNNTWNKNDYHGLIVLILFMVIIITLINYKKWNKYSIYVISVSITSLVIFIATKPIRMLYMFSMIFTLQIKTPPFLDKKKEFPKYILFEEQFKDIQKEIFSLMGEYNGGKDVDFTKNSFDSKENSYIGEDVDVKNNRGWRILQVKLGKLYPENIKSKLPTLVKILNKCPEIISCSISILDEKTKIPIHNGYYKGFMRFMLPVKVPKDSKNVYLCNNYIKYVWKEGESILWDDLYPHKVYNNTDEIRIVIYMDVLRQNISPFLKFLNKIVTSSISNTKMIKDEIKRTEKKERINN